MLLIVLSLIVGMMFGSILCCAFKRQKQVGTLEILLSDEDDPYLFLKLNQDVQSVISKKRVGFKVKIKDLTTQKKQ